MGRFAVISEDAFDALQLDAGVLLSRFDPAHPVRPNSEDIIATTTGGINPTCKATYSDLAEDVDNAPNRTKQFQHLDSWECGMTFTSIKFNASNTAWSLGAADVTEGTGYTKITPRRDVKLSDFKDVWWVGDKANGGAFAIRLINALSTEELSIQSTKNGKGTSSVTLGGFVSIDDQDKMPMEFYDIDPDPSLVTYKVTQNLSHVTSDFVDVSIDSGEELEINLTAEDTYTLGDVIVFMGGEDVTATAYDEGVVSIASVTGDVIITATASL